MVIKINRDVSEKFLYNFFGGIFGAIVVAFFFREKLPNLLIWDHLVNLLFILMVGLIGLFTMGAITYYWDNRKEKEKPKIRIRNWFKSKFNAKRIYTSIGFSAVVGVTYYATTMYEKAFNQKSTLGAVLVFLLLAVVMLLIGGNLLDYIGGREDN